MNRFRFKRTRNRFRWESEFMVLEFSNPSIQGFNSHIPLKSEKDIMYYYYTVSIYKKFETEDKNENEIIQWKLVSSRSTHDFPCITELKWILEEQLKDDTKVNGQKTEYRNGDIEYSKTMSTEGFACDDFYEIRKRIVEDQEENEEVKESYVVYAGTTYDCQGDLNSCGIRTPYVNREDIKKLLKCVSEFIKYSIEEENKVIQEQRDHFDIKNKKIYEYQYDYDCKKVNTSKISSIYAIGDMLNITIVENDKEIEFYKVKLLDVKDNSLMVQDSRKTNYEIELEKIVYIDSEVPKDKVTYKELEVAKDFISILEDEEKQEFKNKNTKFLLKKYKHPIIDRTFLCWEEHGFNIDYNSGDRVKAVTPIVKDIIELIKKELECK